MACEPPQSSPAAAAAPMATCRFCMEEEEEAKMVAPCECTGTQKFVHAECLLRWQTQSLRNRVTCPVCQRCYKSEFVL